MPGLPKVVIEAWEQREGPVVLTTVDAKGVPNAIYASCVSKYDETRLVVADNYFSKTRANLQAGSPGSILFITTEGKAYQVKGRMEYLTRGPVFDDMKSWNPAKHPGVAAACLVVEEIYTGAERLA